MATARSELRQDPGVVIASMLGVAFSVPTLGLTYSIGPFIQPLIAEFGWTRQQILTTQPLMTVAIVAVSAMVGWIADRHGVRRLIMASQLMLGLAFFALAGLLRGLESLYVIYGLMALAGGGTVGIGFARLISQRFNAQRGLALGIALAGSGLCGFLVPPYAAWAVQTFGWRGGYVALGLLPVCIALPLAWRYLHDTAPRPLVADGTALSPTPGGVSLSEALRDYRFWALATGLFVCSGIMTAFVTNMVPLLQESGITLITAGLVASSFGLAVVIGRIAIGGLMDRFFAPLVGAAFLFIAAAGLLGLGTLQPQAWFAAVMVFVIGLAAGAEVDLMAYLTARYFGTRHYGRIFSGQYIAFALGPGLFVPLAGALRDQADGYGSLLGLAGLGVACFGALLLTLGPYPGDPDRSQTPKK